MSPNSKGRCLAAAGAVLSGVLILLPIPVFDLVLMIGVQLAIMVGVTTLLKKRIHLVGQGLFVLGYALAGAAVCLGLQIFVPLLGKFVLAPTFAAISCYVLGELTMFSVNRR